MIHRLNNGPNDDNVANGDNEFNNDNDANGDKCENGSNVDSCNSGANGDNDDSKETMMIHRFIPFLIIHHSSCGLVLASRLMKENKAGYTATLVACGWAGAVLEKVTKTFGREQ